jgi:hypothetical protein
MSNNQWGPPLVASTPSNLRWNFLIGNTIDPRHDHCNAKNHRYWATRGYQTRNPAACNTFTAPPGRVS